MNQPDSQQPQAQQQQQEENFLFRCESDHPKQLIGLLTSFGVSSVSSSSFHNSKSSKTTQRATQATQSFSGGGNIGQLVIYATSSGLSIHQSSAVSSQASMQLDKELFSTYSTGVQDSSSQQQNADCCCVSWNPLRNALNLALTQNPTKLSLSYNLTQEVLQVETDCFSSGTSLVCTAVLGGMVPPDETPELSQAFLSQPILARVLVSSSVLVDVTELSLVNPMAVKLQCSSTSPSSSTSTLQVTAVGPCSECTLQWQIPIEWEDNNTHTRQKIKYSYPYSTWAQAMKPLFDLSAHETCISINTQGILAIQHQLICQDNIAAFCDGLLLPLIADEDERDEDDDTATFSQSQLDEQQSQSTARAMLQNDDNDEEGDDQTTTNRSFFGSLSMEMPPSQTPNTSAPSQRRAQRKRIRQQQASTFQGTSTEQTASPCDIDASLNSPSSTLQQTQSDHEKEDYQYCSSPEVVYGNM